MEITALSRTQERPANGLLQLSICSQNKINDCGSIKRIANQRAGPRIKSVRFR